MWDILVTAAWATGEVYSPALYGDYPHEDGVAEVRDVTGRDALKFPPDPNINVWLVRGEQAIIDAIADDPDYVTLIPPQEE